MSLHVSSASSMLYLHCFYFYPAPLSPPTDVIAISYDPTSIMVEWAELHEEFWGGELLGYKINYTIYTEDNVTVKLINPGFLASTLTGLKPYTLYLIKVCGYNSAGDGPTEYSVMMTQQGGKNIYFLFFGN